jgi:hypothetical protein
LDFWDLTVVIFRRWKISLPLLLLAVGATAYVAVIAKPDYTMTSYVQVIPTKLAPTDNPTSAAMRNPWNQLGLATIAQAAIYTTQDKGFLESLKSAKHSENFTLTMESPNPIVTVQVVAQTPADARETTDLVVGRFRGSVESLQKQAGVQDQDIIPTQRLDQGQNVETSGGKVKRALAAVAAAGLLMVAGGTLAFDALARRRSRRRHEREQAKSAQEAAEQEPVEIEIVNGNEPKLPLVPGQPAGEPEFGAPEVVIPDRLVSGAGTAPVPSWERTAIVVKPTAPVVNRGPAANSARPGEAGTYVSMNAQGEVNGADHDAVDPGMNGDAAANPSDARAVLRPRWLGGQNGGDSQ